MSKQTLVEKLPKCDFCTAKGENTDAQYDGRTVFGSWANMCILHFGQYGTGLGTGRGQELVVKSVATVKAQPGSFEQLDISDDAFKSWMKKVNTGIQCSVGLSAYDLPDAHYRDWFEAGMAPRDAAEIVVTEAMDEVGFDD